MSDLVSREDAIKNAHFPMIDDAGYEVVRVDDILALPSAEPKIYGNEHNCVLTMFGECSYDRNGCGSCEVVDKIRKAINAEPKTGEWGAHGECPFCGYIRQWDDDNFCANCGARMTKGGEDE